MTQTETNLLENLQLQLEELESLQAMFYNPGEIKIEDAGVFFEIKEFVAGKLNVVPPRLGYVVNLLIEGKKFEMCVSLSHDYPFVKPEIFLRSHLLNKVQHVELNKKIGEFLTGLPEGEPCIFTIISWLQDNAHDYCTLEKLENSNESYQEQDDKVLARYWIYSHHIYSKTKRKALTELAHQLNINGFVLPGKPGIICVEGNACDVNEWWQTVKSMNWKRIFCKVTESNKEETKSTNFLKFHGFVEKVFENHGPKYNHMNMGEFFKYLDEHQLAYIFKDLFGVEARSS
ncbi:hypothetical protein ABEB36_004032 [Hypothenemus hampei]|uniref:RWD domain-containing protein n=1 Tax=Hypothenemus hampei TaxID=57062 RepID=A0ABD1F2A9_HYPHA